MSRLRFATALVLVLAVAAGIGIGSFFGVRALTASPSPQAQHPAGVSQEEFERLMEEAAAKPRFEGELLGLYLAHFSVLDAKGFRVDPDEWCPGGVELVTPPTEEQAPVPAYLPPGAGEAVESMTLGPPAGAIVCKEDGRVRSGGRQYDLPPVGGLAGRIVVGRKAHAYRHVDYPYDQVKTAEVGGRPAILAQSFLPNGGPGTSSEIIFPESTGGYLYVEGHDVFFDDLMRVAESLAGTAP